MTFQVDNEALKAAMLRHYETKLNQELREMFIFSQNPDMAEIWKLYMEEIKKKEKNKSDNVGVMQWVAMLYGIAIIIYGICLLFPNSPT